VSQRTFFFDVILTVHRRSYVKIECQLDATEVFIAVLIACSTCFGHHYALHQELKSIIQWLLAVVFGAVVFKLLFWCGAEGYVSGLQDAAAKWCPKHLEQAIRTAIKTSVASSWHSISTYEHSFVSMQQRAIYLKTYVRCIFAGDINLP